MSFSSSSSLLSSHLRVSTSSFIFHPPRLAPSPSLSVHPSLPAALWQQSVMGLGCRRTVKAPPCPSSSSSAPLHPCCPLPQGPAQSIFTQVMRWAETQRRLFPSRQPDPDPCPVTHLLLFKAQLSKIFQFSSVSSLIGLNDQLTSLKCD